MKFNIKNSLAYLIVFITVISVNQWSAFPIGNTYTNWAIYVITIFLFLKGKKIYYDPVNNHNIVFFKLYLFWLCVCIIRGFFVAEFYWDYKSLVGSGSALLIACSIFIFMNPQVIHTLLSTWLKYALPLFFFFVFFISKDSYGYFLIPLTFLALFFPALNLRWKLIILVTSIFVVFADLDARSNVIKFILPVLFSFLFFFKKFLYSKYCKLLFKVMFVLPFFFLSLGISNVFDIFNMDEYITGTYTEKKIVNGEIMVSDLKADTRTFLYEEVITSAVNNDYVLIGRTPARGNDSKAFGMHAAEELETGRYERYGNEVSILNIFTWTGLIGVVLYFLVFYQAASLAIIKSNSYFLKIIGLYISFRWDYAWVEDFHNFNIMNVILWMIIAMSYSVQFRKMTDMEFKSWLLSILIKKRPRIVYKPSHALHNHSGI